MGILQIIGVLKTVVDLVVQIWGAITGKKRSAQIQEGEADAKAKGDTTRIDDVINNH